MRAASKRFWIYCSVVFGSIFAGAWSANRLIKPDLTIPDLTKPDPAARQSSTATSSATATTTTTTTTTATESNEKPPRSA